MNNILRAAMKNSNKASLIPDTYVISHIALFTSRGHFESDYNNQVNFW